jgi:hypothetical protein
MGMPRLRDRALAAPFPGGIFRGDQPQAFHEFSGGIDTRQVADCGDPGDSHSAWHAEEGLECLDHRLQAPSFDLVVECLCQALEPFGLCVHSPDLCLKDDVLRRSWTHDCGEPPSVRWSPMGLAGRADGMAEEKGCEAARGVLEIVDGIFPCPTQVANGFILHCRDVDGCQVPRAHQAGQCDGVSPVGLHPIPGFFGDQGGRHDPADMAFFGEITVEPIATRASFIDKDEVRAFGWQPTDECIDVTLSCPSIAERDDLGVVFLGDIGDGNRVFMNIHSDGERARLCHG